MPLYNPIQNSDLIQVADIENNFNSDNVEGVLAELGTDRTSAKVKLNENTSAIKAIEETLVNVNSNAEARLTQTTADRVVSLPKNAGEGGLKSVINGMTLQNLIKNGNFANGTTGWTGNAASISIVDGKMNVTADGTQAYGQLRYGTVTAIINNVYYIKIRVRVTNALCQSITMNRPYSTSPYTLSAPTQNQWYTVTTVVTANQTQLLWFAHNYADAATANGKVMEVQNVLAIDLDAHGLTAATVADMDKLTASYFEGVKSVIAPRVRSIGKNLLRRPYFAEKIMRVVNNSAIVYKATVDNRNCLVMVGNSVLIGKQIMNGFKANTQYAFSCFIKNIDGVNNSGGIFYIIYSDGTGSYFGAAGVTNSWQQVTVVSTAGKTIAGLYTYVQTSGKITYFDLDTFQIEEKAAVSAFEPYKESFLYPEPKTLCRLPNGVCDTIENGNLIQRVKEYTLQASDITNLGTAYANVDLIYSTTLNTTLVGHSAWSSINNHYATGWTSGVISDATSAIGIADAKNNNLYYFVVAKGAYANLAAAQTALTGTKIYYQLATPIVTENVTSGIPISYPSGSIILEPALADAGVYTDKMSILQTGFPISSLESIKKINAITGEETPLDVSTAVINANKLSFTHPNLALNDIVFFTYFYPETGCYGSNTFSYFDSRYVKVDSVTGKYYKIDFSIADGVPAFNLVEVV